MDVVISFLDDVLGMVEYIDGLGIGTNKTETTYSGSPDRVWEKECLGQEGQDAWI